MDFEVLCDGGGGSGCSMGSEDQDGFVEVGHGVSSVVAGNADAAAGSSSFRGTLRARAAYNYPAFQQYTTGPVHEHLP